MGYALYGHELIRELNPLCPLPLGLAARAQQIRLERGGAARARSSSRPGRSSVLPRSGGQNPNGLECHRVGAPPEAGYDPAARARHDVDVTEVLPARRVG
jgi:hypothetical protein